MTCDRFQRLLDTGGISPKDIRGSDEIIRWLRTTASNNSGRPGRGRNHSWDPSEENQGPEERAGDSNFIPLEPPEIQPKPQPIVIPKDDKNDKNENSGNAKDGTGKSKASQGCFPSLCSKLFVSMDHASSVEAPRTQSRSADGLNGQGRPGRGGRSQAARTARTPAHIVRRKVG